jgi:hypothetical protein
MEITGYMKGKIIQFKEGKQMLLEKKLELRLKMRKEFKEWYEVKLKKEELELCKAYNEGALKTLEQEIEYLEELLEGLKK